MTMSNSRVILPAANRELGMDDELFAKLATASLILQQQARRSFPPAHVEKLLEYAAAVDEAAKRLRDSLMPGWVCGACGVFNGDAKERLRVCRCCGLARRT